MRSRKDSYELSLLKRAIAYSIEAHKLVAQYCIAPGKSEHEVEASFDMIFKAWGVKHGYQPVITSGENALTLHRHSTECAIGVADLILLDVSAEYGNYKADITRTYPVSGRFTPRQKELYNLVLAAHDYIAGLARPGYSLNGNGERSLFQLTKAFFDDHGGYGKYFPHGLGHFLGLEAHDAGLPMEPLEEGQVITIEPGLYIPKEKIGIRIEDDYLVTKDGVRCLTDVLPRKAEEIEALMEGSLSEHSEIK
jgi:Xaa-Pro aminopeptidase